MIGDYVGIPYLLHGTTREGLDCWGLPRLWYREQYGIELPSFGDRYGRELDAVERAHIAEVVRGESPKWQSIRQGHEQRGDLVLFRVAGEEAHLGVVLDAGRFLHARPGTDSCVERYDSPVWARRVAGFYRWRWGIQ